MKRLCEKDRQFIAYSLRENKNISTIAKELCMNKTTISREIKKNRKVLINKKRPLIHREDIDINKHICSILMKPPYVCNGCPRYINNHCTYHYVIYNVFEAQSNYDEKLKNCHKKSKTKYDRLLKIIQERLDIGQPISHILLSFDEEGKISRTSIYNLINKGELRYKKKKIKKRERRNIEIRYVNREDLLKGKTYIDFLEYVSNNPKDNIVEIDLLCGNIYSRAHIF